MHIEGFTALFGLCMKVMDQCIDQSIDISVVLQIGCLKTLQAVMIWIPMDYFFEEELLSILASKFMLPIATRLEAVRTFKEISSLNFEG